MVRKSARDVTPLYPTGLLDRLLDGRGGAQTLEQLKDAVARGLEDLLNTRVALPAGLLESYSACTGSILNYGLGDFAGYCLSSSEDRRRLCLGIRDAIERHEPRLRQVQVCIEPAPGMVNRISIIIRGVLAAGAVGGAVSFDAVLQPSTLHYSINRSASGAPA